MFGARICRCSGGNILSDSEDASGCYSSPIGRIQRVVFPINYNCARNLQGKVLGPGVRQFGPD